MRRRTIFISLAFLAFSAILLSLFLFQPPQGPPSYQPKAQPSPSISMQECGIANSEGGYSGFCTLLLDTPHANTSFSIFLFPQKPKTSVYFLDYPHIEARDYGGLNSYLEKRFSESGILFHETGYERLQTVSDSIILIPTGVFPKPLYENLQNISEKNNVLVYMGASPDYLLEADGSIISNPSPPSISLPSPSRWNSIPLKSSYIYSSRLSLDKFKSAKEAGEELFQIAVSHPWLSQASQAQFSLDKFKGKKTIFFPTQLSEGHPRLFSGEQGIVRDFNKIEKPAGNLLHAKSSAYSRGLEVQAALNKSFSSSVFLSLSLFISRDGAETGSEWIGNASMREIWFRSFPLSRELSPGDYLLSIRDQYSQTYAQSYLHIKNITAAKLPEGEGANLFIILQDGHPIADSFAEISLENKTSLGSQPVVGGVIRLPEGIGSPGPSTFYFEIEGVRISAQSSPPQNIFSFYATYGIPAIALVIIAYLFFKRRTSRFCVVFPDMKPQLFSQVKMKKSQAFHAIAIAQSEFPSICIGITLQDARRALQKEARKQGKDVIFSEETTLDALNSLATEGRIGNYSDYYSLPGQNPKKAAILRMAYDSLVSSGKKFRAGKEGRMHCSKGIIEAFSDGPIPLPPKQGRLLLVFESGQGISDFEESLRCPEGQKLKLKLALQARKLVLCVPEGLPELL